jgi:hypothetical protein
LGFVLKVGIAMRIDEVLTPARLIFFGTGLRETLRIGGHAPERAPAGGIANGLWTAIVASLTRR